MTGSRDAARCNGCRLIDKTGMRAIHKIALRSMVAGILAKMAYLAGTNCISMTLGFALVEILLFGLAR